MKQQQQLSNFVNLQPGEIGDLLLQFLPTLVFSATTLQIQLYISENPFERYLVLL